MFNMDLTSKGITWVGNIYQKFEAMCQDVYEEVDGMIIQENAKYVESQVQTGCENVRKFCAEVVQDLFLPPACTVKVPVSDLSLSCGADDGMCKRTEKGFEECPVNEKMMPPIESERVVSSGKNTSSTPLVAKPQEDNHREECVVQTEESFPISIDAKNTEGNSVNSAELLAHRADLSTVHTSESVLPVESSHEHFVAENGPLQFGHVISCDVIDASESLKALPLVGSSINGREKSQKTDSMVESLGNAHDKKREPATPATVFPSPEMVIDTKQLFSGRLSDFDWQEASNSDAIEPSAESEEEFEDVKFEDNSEDAEPKDGTHPISHHYSNKRSYKKKLRDALSSKLRFAKKHDHGGQMGLTFTSSTVIVDFDPQKLETHDCYESEWELL